MDFTQGLVRAILEGGKPAYREYLQRGIPDEIIQGAAKPALSYIATHFAAYGELPSIAIIEGKLGIPLPQGLGGATAAFWADEIIANAIGNEVKFSVDKSLQLLSQQKNIESLEELQQAVFRIQRLQTANADARVTSMLDEGPNVWDYYQRMKNGERGILTPWPSINDSTLGFGPEELILFVARSGIGKCVEKSTKCVDPVTGLVHTIEEVVQNPKLRKVWTWSKDQGIYARDITAKVDTGRKKCLKVTFASGRTVTVTPEHPLLTPEGWRKAAEVQTGTTLALPAKTMFPQEPQPLSEAHVDLLAIMMADGSCTAKHLIFTKEDPVVVQRAREAAHTLGLELHGLAPGSNWSFCWPEGARPPGAPHPVRELLEQHGLAGKLSKEKTIPDAVFRLPKELLARFIGVFWMCDGYVSKLGPEIVLASENLIDQLQHLLLRFGIQSHKAAKPTKLKGKVFDAWRLRVYALSYETMYEEIPMWGEKRARLAALVELDRNSNVGFPRVSNALRAKIYALAATRSGRWNGGALDEIGQRLGRVESSSRCRFSVRDMFGPGNSLRASFRTFCEVYGVEAEYRWLWDSGIFWDEVTDIKDVGVQKIYDLTVEPTSCFVANDIIVHNTWVSLLVTEHAWAGYPVWVKKADGKIAEESRKHRVLYVTTEMSKLRIALRFYAIREHLPYGRLRSGSLTAFEEEKLQKSTTGSLKESGLDIVGGNFDFRVETLAAAIDESKPEMVVIDGIYLIQVPGKDRIEKAANAFSEVKRMATQKKVPIVVTSQFNREVKANQAATARVESVALTDAAVWHSTLVFGMVQTDEQKVEKRMQIKQLKVRDGFGEDFDVDWDFEMMNFSEVKKGSTLAGGASGISDALSIGDGVGDTGPTEEAPF